MIAREVEVRLRHTSELTGKPVFSVPVSELSSVIPLISSWGVSSDGESYDDFCGQFRADDDAAYFEVIYE